MLGAGFVTRPTLDVLTQSGIPVTVGGLPRPILGFTLDLGLFEPLTTRKLNGCLVS